MFRQPTRWERHLTAIESAAEKGNFSTTLFLYPSEYRKLDKMGFSLSDPKHPFNALQPIEVSWDSFMDTLFDKSECEKIFDYCLSRIDELPAIELFADKCLIKSVRNNLKRCSDPIVVAYTLITLTE